MKQEEKDNRIPYTGSKLPPLRHVFIAKKTMQMENPEMAQFIQIENEEDLKGVPPVVKFTIQSDPIKEVGLNGLQARDMIEYCWHLISSLDARFPHPENETTLKHLKLAVEAQDRRTAERSKRGVEGEYKM